MSAVQGEPNTIFRLSKIVDSSHNVMDTVQCGPDTCTGSVQLGMVRDTVQGDLDICSGSVRLGTVRIMLEI